MDSWVELEDPDTDVRVAVLEWIFTRADRPYHGVQREPAFENLWFGVVPGTRRGLRVVMCSYWILENERAVRCDLFGTLDAPI